MQAPSRLNVWADTLPEMALTTHARIEEDCTALLKPKEPQLGPQRSWEP